MTELMRAQERRNKSLGYNYMFRDTCRAVAERNHMRRQNDKLWVQENIKKSINVEEPCI